MNFFDLNELPSGEEERDVFDVKPFVGQVFSSEEEALAFYENYAKRHGFIVRKDHFVKKNEKIVRRDFYCNRARHPTTKKIDPSKKSRNKPSFKCGCTAHLRISLRRSSEIFPEEWHVTTFSSDHSHEILSLAEMRFVPAIRTISSDDKDRILLLKEAGLNVRQIVRVIELEKNVSHGELSFMEKDILNLYTKIQKQFATNDVMALLESFECAKVANSKFQYAYTIDDERRLEHLFWSPARCFDWYERFGDAVVFDTTYKVNAYDMPCAFFVGVDNHGKSVLFGCALLRNETTNTFKWLMKKFVTLMKKHPQTMITYQDPWMAEAIATELPFTKHAFCIWHITAKFSSWFNSTLQGRYSQWCADFQMLYKLESDEEFEHHWPIVLQKYGLHENKHIKGLYQIKQSWVPAYLHDYFFAGMTTNGRSESINAFIKRFVHSHNSLVDFAKQVDIGIKEMEQTQLHENMLAKYKQACLKTMSPLEEQAFMLLTPFAFGKFREEFEKSSRYSVAEADEFTYLVKFYEEKCLRSHNVFWDGQRVMCRCKHFEFRGVLCRHILRVLLQANCFSIPTTYLPMRWRHNGLDEYVVSFATERNTVDGEIFMEATGSKDVQCPPKSTTKGRPKKKCMQGGKEMAKKPRTCGFCSEKGHYISTCPNKENVDNSNTSSVPKRVTPTDLGINPIFSLKF